MTATILPRIGVSTSPPSIAELKQFAYLVLDNIRMDASRIGANRISRAAIHYHEKMNAGFWPFYLYLCDHIFDIAQRDRDAARRDVEMDIARVCIDYSDPTGDQAVRNVLRERA